MTDEQINAAIVEACGRRQKPNGEWFPSNGLLVWSQGIPDYCNDLNAMHEAEKVLDVITEWIGEEHNGSAEEAWMAHLCVVIARDANQRVHDDWLFVHATARHRAEAFLRTLGKWKNKND